MSLYTNMKILPTIIMIVIVIPTVLKLRMITSSIIKVLNTKNNTQIICHQLNLEQPNQHHEHQFGMPLQSLGGAGNDDIRPEVATHEVKRDFDHASLILLFRPARRNSGQNTGFPLADN